MHENMINMYRKFDDLSNHEYADIWEQRIKKNQFGILYCKGEYKELLAPKYKEVRKNLKFKRRMDIYLSSIFPRFTKYLKNRIFGTPNIGL